MQIYPALKKAGVRLMRGVASFQARHSLVGTGPVLDIEPTELHQRVPLIIGSQKDVETFERFMAE